MNQIPKLEPAIVILPPNDCLFGYFYYPAKSAVPKPKEIIRRKLYNCKKCAYETNSHCLIKKHLIHHYSTSHLPDFFDCANSIEPYKCEKCAVTNYLMCKHKKHLKSNHDNAKYEEMGCIQSYICKNCTFETHSILILMKHIHNECIISDEIEDSFITGWFKCEQWASKSFEKNKVQIYMLDRNKFSAEKCEECLQMVSLHEWFGNHLVKKHKIINDLEYKCQQCSYKTRTGISLERHVGTKHGNLTYWFKCKHCTFKSQNRSLLVNHTKRKHPQCITI